VLIAYPSYSQEVAASRYPDTYIDNACLLIMNPRRIDRVIDSIKPINIKKVWFTGFNSLQISGVLNDYVKNTNYDYYIVTSDDLVLNQTAFTNVLDKMSKFDVFTGYCNLYVDSEYVSLAKSPVTLKQQDYPRADDYDLLKLDEVVNYKNQIIETFLVSYSITTIKRDLWLEFPFAKYTAVARGKTSGVSSDHNFSMRLTNAGIKMFTHRDSFCYHLKQPKGKYLYGQANKDGWLVGNVKPVVTEE